jgi:hypothetical protein
MKPCKYILEIHSNIVINYLTTDEFRHFFVDYCYDSYNDDTEVFTYICKESNIKYERTWGAQILRLVK